ncbi:MAG: protoheme IX farnesyltransferase [Alphaproteobacteria bacterium]|nr:protoheme IX farnesyltransferase [Alphaproteobacteria bacterium]
MTTLTATAAPDTRSLPATARLLWDMTRPRVLLLVLFTALPALAMAGGGWPELGLSLLVLTGTALCGGACSVLNAYVERDSDAHMARTRQRPLPAASMAPWHALLYGLALSVASVALLGWVGGAVAAVVGAVNILFYVVVYTAWLKRRTPQNIVIGGAAGATAPIIAEAALTGQITSASLILFLIIFTWTPPHFWAIALFRKDEYAAAGLPMMPNVVGDQGTRWRMLAYTLVLIPITIAPVWVGHLGWLYGAAAVALGGWFTWHNVRVIQAANHDQDRAMFKASILYLFLLFGIMLVDLAVPTQLL